MQVSKWLMVVLTVCLLGGKAFSQSADDIINKNLDAMGGKDKLATLKTVYEETSTSAMGNELPGKTWFINGQGFRSEINAMGSSIVTVITKDTGWMVNPLTGNTNPQPLPAEAVKQSIARLDLRGQFLNYAQHGYTATLQGSEKVNGKDCYKIKLSKPGEGDVLYFVDATTYFVDKVSSSAKVNGSDITADVLFGDYKKTPDGFVFPNSTTFTTPQGDITATVTKVVPNQAVDPTLLQKP
jgi:hypothetical protein